MNSNINDRDASNADPITGEPGAHPAGVAVGTTAGTLAGAAIGSVIGPIGTVVGGLVGAVAGGLAGKATAESYDPTIAPEFADSNGLGTPAGVVGQSGSETLNPQTEEAYWRSHYATEPYASGFAYEQLHDAYRTAYENYPLYRGRRFDDVETELQQRYERSGASLPWFQAKLAARSAWHRIERVLPGDFDRDGR